MMKISGRKKFYIKWKRLQRSIRIQLRWGMRRFRRFLGKEQFKVGLRGSYARRLYCTIGLILLVGVALFFADSMSNAFLTDEAALIERLSEPAPDGETPVKTALHCFGATNRLQVTVKTEKYRNFQSEERVDLDRGNVNLVLTLQDGSYMEYTLENRNIDNFESGYTDQFTLMLPDTVSPFDIAGYKLTLMPDAAGNYGRWHCEWAQVSFLLGGERTLLAKDNWEQPFIFSEEDRSDDLIITATDNAYYNQVSELYPDILNICKNKKETVHQKSMKSAALNELGLSSGDTLYFDIETVSIENQNSLISPLLLDNIIPGHEQMNYDGKMTLRLHFYTDAAGAYYKDFDLDTLGKDDFELGTVSTFDMILPDGLCVFDIHKIELLVEDPTDYWAPRMMRLYMRTDYGTVLELSRFTDTTLKAVRGTNIFGQGLIETAIDPLSFDLTAEYVQPQSLKEEIEGRFGLRLSNEAYSMYFSKFDFYERQKLFYNQMNALYGENADEEK